MEEYNFVYLPAYERYAWKPKDHPRQVIFDNLKKKVFSEVSKQGWEIVDIDSYFSMSENPLKFYPFETHAQYTPKGYSLIARLINKSIVQ